MSKKGLLATWGGALEKYGIRNLAEGTPIGEQVFFLEGLSIINNESLFLPCVKTETEISIDIHIVPGTNHDWILLLDATAKEIQQKLLQQKGNSLSLLQQKIQLAEKSEENSHGDILLVNDLLDGIGVVLLELTSNNKFIVIGRIQDWFKNFYPEVYSADIEFKPQEHFAFLENFLIDANAFWKQKKFGRLRSGAFIEVDRLDNECAVEATALCIGDKKIVLFELLGNAYEERKHLLQRARENTLVRDYLEAEVRKRTAEIRRREEEIALRLVWAAESHDKETGDHIRRIGHYSCALARAIGWKQMDADDILVAATMHDIGKIGIPDKILKKPSGLLPAEYEIMKTHTEIGAKILEDSDVTLLQMARDIALYHHERWDGSGYPQGLKGKAIPQSARIVTIVDVYDALITRRVYKVAEPEEKVIAMMKTEIRRHFDPEIFESFIGLLPEFRKIRHQFSGG